MKMETLEKIALVCYNIFAIIGAISFIPLLMLLS